MTVIAARSRITGHAQTFFGNANGRGHGMRAEYRYRYFDGCWKDLAVDAGYAWAEAGFFDKTKDDTIVVLTDGPVPEKTLHDHFGLQKLVADGKIAYVRATINSSGQIINFEVGHRAFKMPPSGGSTEHVFEGKIQPASINGKVFTKGAQEAPFEKTKYEYSATFRAPLQPKK